jgi:hypothetical protein
MPPALDSREYKFMLQAPRFAGAEAELLAKMGTYWQDFRSAVAAADLITEGAFTLSKQRPVTFYDTADRHLNNRDVLFRDYVFRARKRTDGSAKVTLKYRHPDQLVATDRNMRAAKKRLKKTATKLEKDIKPVDGRMRSLYSYSSSGRTRSDCSVATVGDIMALFPGLKSDLDVDEKEPVTPVGGFMARELVLTGGRLRLGTVQVAECAAVLWYDASAHSTTPVVADFSFRHPAEATKAPRFTATEARAAYRAFRTALALDAWIAPRQQTKTAYVYER